MMPEQNHDQNHGQNLYIGLMSGTSMDGVDGVIARFSPQCETLAHAHQPFPPALRAQFMALQQPGTNEIEREALAANELATLYAACIEKLLQQSGLAAHQIRAVGAHGQTIRHRPEQAYTRQSQNPARLAELTGMDVIADFRSRDIAAGGQGAPLVPAFHQALFAKAGVCRALVNIGGMSNMSVLYGNGQVQGCDTGPGNVLLDGWIDAQHGLPFDADGAWAASGQVCPALLSTLQSAPFLALPPPKSTGRDVFHMAWLQQQLAQHNGVSAVDVQTTLTAFTAHTIADMLLRSSMAIETVYVCGGGAKNTYLMAVLAKALPNIVLTTTAALGIAPDQVEALAFAWLARCHLLRQHGNLPVVTGALGGRILGACYPA